MNRTQLDWWAVMESIRLCSIAGCGRKPVGRGWCSRHWQRWRKYGDPLAGGPAQRTRKAVVFPDGTRECSRCKVRLPTEMFDRDARGTGGRRAQCKQCRSKRMARYYVENAEAKKAYERLKRRGDPDKARQADAVQYERHRASKIENATDAAHRRRQRVQNAGTEHGVTRRALRAIHGDRCCYCGIVMSFDHLRKGQYRPDLATVEHVLPISKGGAHTFENTCLACWRCNIRRGNREGIAA